MSKGSSTQAPVPDPRPAAAGRPGSQRAAGRARPSAPGGGGKSRTGARGISIPARIGLGIALATLFLDQATKLYTYFVFDLPVREPVAFGPFVNLIVVWNRGISYGLFQQNTELGRWILVLVSVLASVGLSFWIGRTQGKLLAAALGLIVGGAIGNVIDRLIFGAVFDFIQSHVGAYSWYVFNVADAAIVAGVVGLLYDSFLLEKRRTR